MAATRTKPAPEAEAPAPEPESETTALARPTGERLMSIQGVTLTRTAAILPAKMPLKTWVAAVESISAIREASRFWLGDLLNAGEERYGEKYTQALDATGLDYGSLRNITSLAAKIPPERRREELTWTHHSAVSALEPETADELLQKAIDENLSVSGLKALVADYRAPRPRRAAAPEAPSTNGTAATATPDGSVAGEVENVGAEGEWGCTACDATFNEVAWHCNGCNRHWPEAAQSCPVCEGTAGAVTGDLVITPADQVAEAPSGFGVLSLIQRLSVAASALSPDLVYADAVSADYPRTMADTLSDLMAADNYLQTLIEMFAADGTTAENASQSVSEAPETVPDVEDDSEAADEEETAPVVVNQAASRRTANAPSVRPAPKPGGKSSRRTAPKPSEAQEQDGEDF